MVIICLSIQRRRFPVSLHPGRGIIWKWALPEIRSGRIQEQLARISQAYPAIPTITPDGIYGEATKAAVEKFQSIFGLPVTGVVDYRTWYKISEIYVAVTRIAELV